MKNHLHTVAENWRDREWWKEVAATFVARESIAAYHEVRNTPRSDIMSEDWDNLIILDACRYDLFKDANTIDGRLEYRYSKGSSTPEFLSQNFQGKSFDDTVYVTSNPQVEIRLSDNFFKTVNVWIDDWDDDAQTVRPDAVVESTKRAYEKYPGKRIISHFMQPHYPFVGKCSERLGKHSGFELSRREALDDDPSRDYDTIWEMLKSGEVTRQAVWTAYRENLQYVLPYAKEVVDSLDGKTVVTSDHGNMFGEYAFPFPVRMYGHPPGVYTPELIKVPWLTIESGNRRETEVSYVSNDDVSESETAVERLRHLGYTE